MRKRCSNILVGVLLTDLRRGQALTSAQKLNRSEQDLVDATRQMQLGDGGENGPCYLSFKHRSLTNVALARSGANQMVSRYDAERS